MTTAGCSTTKCPPESELRSLRLIVSLVAVVVVFIVYFGISWRPVLPEFDSMVESCWSRIKIPTISAFLCGLVAQSTQDIADENGVGTNHTSIFETMSNLVTWILGKIRALQGWMRSALF